MLLVLPSLCAMACKARTKQFARRVRHRATQLVMPLDSLPTAHVMQLLQAVLKPQLPQPQWLVLEI